MELPTPAPLQAVETSRHWSVKINFLKPIWKAKLTAVGHVVKVGARLDFGM